MSDGIIIILVVECRSTRGAEERRYREAGILWKSTEVRTRAGTPGHERMNMVFSSTTASS